MFENFLSFSNRIFSNNICFIINFCYFSNIFNVESHGGAISYSIQNGNLTILNSLFITIKINSTYFGAGIYSLSKNSTINNCCFFNCSSARGPTFRINPYLNASIKCNFCSGSFSYAFSQDTFDFWNGYHYIYNLNSSYNYAIGDGSGFQICSSN